MPRHGGPKDTPERRAKIIEVLRAGNTRKASCAFAGVSEDTFALMLKRHSDFSDAVKEAEAFAEVAHVANIAKASRDGNWTASAWWLERRRHEDWRKREEVQHTGKDGESLPIVVLGPLGRTEDAGAAGDG